MSPFPSESPSLSQPEKPVQKRRRGRLDDSLAAPRAVFASPEQRAASDSDNKPPKRRRGGQPGNTNALKHGLYLAGDRLRNSARVAHHIPEINDLIDKLNRSIQVTYEVSLNTDNLVESTEALRSLSMAVNGLIRLINLSNKSGKSTFTPGLDEYSAATYQALLAKYKQLRTDARTYVKPQGTR